MALASCPPQACEERCSARPEPLLRPHLMGVCVYMYACMYTCMYVCIQTQRHVYATCAVLVIYTYINICV